MKVFMQRQALLFVTLVLGRFVFESIQVDKLAPLPTEEHVSTNNNGVLSTSSPYANYEVVTNNYGWNTPSGNIFPSCILGREFFNANIAFPTYNSSAWADSEANPNPNRQIVAFLDIDTCVETNHHIYGGANWKTNV